MKIQNINIFIPTEFCNNFEILGDIFETEVGKHKVKVNIFNQNVKARTEEDKVLCNMDLAVISSMGMGCSTFTDELVARTFLKEKQIVNLPRLSKPEQMVKLLHYISDIKNKEGFILPKTYYQTSKGTHFNRFALEHLNHGINDLVIKPVHGARGIGQIIVSANRTVSISKIVDIIDGCGNSNSLLETLNKFNEKYPGTISYSTEKSVNDGSKTILVSDEEKHIKVDARVEDEGLTAVLRQGFYIQEVVKDIVLEYRLITNFHGEIVYCQKREIEVRSDGFPQACGSVGKERGGAIENSFYDVESCFEPKPLKLLRDIAKHVVGPLNSIDVFVTKNGKWGIFEYCNQFGIEGVPKTIAYHIHEKFIKDFIISSDILEN